MKVVFIGESEPRDICRETQKEWESLLTVVTCSPNMTLVGLRRESLEPHSLYLAAQWLHEVEAQMRSPGQIGLRIQISAMFQYGLMGFPTITLINPLYMVTFENMSVPMRTVVLENYLNAIDPSKLITAPADLGLLKS